MKISSLLEGFQLFQGAGPVFVEQAREGAVGQQAASGLAFRAVVGLVVGVADSLDLGAASRTRQAVAAVHRHRGAERGYLFGEGIGGLGADAIGPFEERRARRVVEPRDFRIAQLLRHRDWRELRAMQDLVGVRIADSAEDVRIGERALERVIGRAQRRRERLEGRLERLDTSRAERRQPSFACDYVERGAMLRAGLGEPQPSAIELEHREQISPARFGRRRIPVQPAGNHEMQHQPQIAGDSDRDPLADPPNLADGFAVRRAQRRIGRAQHKERLDRCAHQAMTGYAGV